MRMFGCSCNLQNELIESSKLKVKRMRILLEHTCQRRGHKFQGKSLFPQTFVASLVIDLRCIVLTLQAAPAPLR